MKTYVTNPAPSYLASLQAEEDLHFTRQLTNHELQDYLTEMPDDAELLSEVARRAS